MSKPASIYVSLVLLGYASLLQASSAAASHNIKSLLADHNLIRSETEPPAANMEMLVSRNQTINRL